MILRNNSGFISMSLFLVLTIATLVVAGGGTYVYLQTGTENLDTETESANIPSEHKPVNETVANDDSNTECTLVANVRIFNDSGSERRIITNTRLEDSAKHTFKLTDSVVVPAGQNNFIEAAVFADQEDYQSENIGEKFIIPGYAGTTDFEKFYAELLSIENACWENVEETAVETKVDRDDDIVSVETDTVIPSEVTETQQVSEEPETEVNPAITAIDDFLADPTLRNLTGFCENAKNLDGPETWETLNEDRTKMQEEIMPLDESVGLPCDIVFNEILYESPDGVARAGEEYQWNSYDEDLIVQYDDNDTDRQRELKIKYNDFVQSLEQYNLFAYPLNTFEEGTTIKTIFLDALNDETSLNYITHWLSNDIIIPERVLLGIKQQF